MNFSNVFSKLKSSEDSFKDSVFFAPVVARRPIRVRIDGVIMEMKVVRPKNFSGWGVFKPISFREAEYVREPTLEERNRYSSILPVVHCTLCINHGDVWYAVPASDDRFKFDGIVPVQLAEEVRVFDHVNCRFDGINFWFDGIDRRQPASHADNLRTSLAELKRTVEFPGLTVQDNRAYTIALTAAIEARKLTDEERIKDALKRGGAQYVSHVKRGDSFTVEMKVDGTTFRPTVNSQTLEIMTAGICLVDHTTGEAHDKDYDLQSFVGLLKEGMDLGRIYRL